MNGWQRWRGILPSVDRLSTGWTRVRQDETTVVIAAFLVCALLNGIGTIMFFELIEWLELRHVDLQPAISPT